MQTLTDFLADDQGATAMEYGLISAAICLVILASLTTMGAALNTTFDYLVEGMSA
jgi:pilus assembly protein Flp/PilA